MEYGEYIKFIILGIAVIAILFFLVKRILKNKKKEAQLKENRTIDIESQDI